MSLDTILRVPEALNDRSPAAVAYKAAIRWQGRVLAELGGRKVMREAMRCVADLQPERSARREAVMDAACAWATTSTDGARGHTAVTALCGERAFRLTPRPRA